jgi:hypothetical protein
VVATLVHLPPAAVGRGFVSVQARPERGRPDAIVLVCDRCGAEAAVAVQLRDWYVLWPATERVGWRGDPSPFGTHRCPGCRPPTDTEV